MVFERLIFFYVVGNIFFLQAQNLFVTTNRRIIDLYPTIAPRCMGIDEIASYE
jgi:hypothetical protein